MATPTQLAAAAACLECAIPRGMEGAIQIVLLQQIAGNTMTPAQLAAAAACYGSCIPQGAMGAIMVYLLDQIASLPAPVSDAVTCGDVDPTVAPSSGCGLYYNRVSKALFAYNSTLAIWELKV